MVRNWKSVVVVAVAVMAPVFMSGCEKPEDNSECGYTSGEYYAERSSSVYRQSSCEYAGYSQSNWCSKDGKCFCVK